MISGDERKHIYLVAVSDPACHNKKVHPDYMVTHQPSCLPIRF